MNKTGQKSVISLAANGVLRFEWKWGEESFLSSLAPVKALGLKRADVEQLKLEPLGKENAPVFKIEDADLGPEWGGKLISIEFIDRDPVFRTNAKSCIWIQSGHTN